MARRSPSDEAFRGEVARLPAERVATLYSRADALRDSLIGTVGILGLGDLASARLLAGLLPLDLVGSIVLEPDRVIVERWQPAGPHQPGERTTDHSAELVPAAIGLYAELSEFGRLLSALGDAIGDDVRGQGLREVDLEVARFEAAIGRPIGQVGDWLGDVAFAIALPDETAHVGVTGLAVDEEAAAEVLDGFSEWLAQSGVPLRQAEVAGRPVVMIDLPFLFGSITLEYALADDVLLLGVEGFIEWVASGDRFLVDDPDYASALGEIDGRENAGVVYLPIARWLEWSEANGADPFGDDPSAPAWPRLTTRSW